MSITDTTLSLLCW